MSASLAPPCESPPLPPPLPIPAPAIALHSRRRARPARANVEAPQSANQKRSARPSIRPRHSRPSIPAISLTRPPFSARARSAQSGLAPAAQLAVEIPGPRSSIPAIGPLAPCGSRSRLPARDPGNQPHAPASTRPARGRGFPGPSIPSVGLTRPSGSRSRLPVLNPSQRPPGQARDGVTGGSYAKLWSKRFVDIE